MVRKHQLDCCALCQITAKNEDSIEAIASMVRRTKKEAKEVWNTANRDSGERAMFCITTPHETNLADNLYSLGFKPIAAFNRRNGYPQTGLLTMWFINF